MWRLPALLCALLCVVVCSGCGAAKIQELTAEVEVQKAKAAKLAAENAQLQEQLTAAKQERERFEKIKLGYEAGRAKMKEQLQQLAPLLGATGSPLPPFEALSDSNWAGNFAPGAKLAPGLKELQTELQGLLGPEPKKPSP
jgi:outer membrane murein-binding lipoprotein Lpp